MAENDEKKPDTNISEKSTDIDLLKELQNVRETTVSRDEHQALQEKYNELVKMIVDGKTPADETPTEKVNLEDIRKKLFSERCELSNLDYVKNVVALRKELIAKGGDDPFLPSPKAKGVVIEQSDREAAQRVADVFEQCIEYAEGDSQLFTQELQRRTTEAMRNANAISKPGGKKLEAELGRIARR